MTPPRERRPSRTLTRADLPAELTPDSLRHLDLRRLGQLRRPGNGVLTPEEQAQYDVAFDTLLAEVRDRLKDADGRVRRGGPKGLDPEMRRFYERAQKRLAEQSQRAQQALPPSGGEAAETPAPPTAPAEETHDADTDADADAGDDGEDVSADSLTEDIEESSTILELLDRIAGIEEQQLAHQESQLLLDTRGFFFAFLVSVAVIIAGVAPLVDAEPHDRLLIIGWTVLACALAGLVYAGVRIAQRRR